MKAEIQASRPAARPVLAVFDFDGTITYADSFMPFLREAAGPVGFWCRLPFFLPVLAALVLGLISETRAKEMALRFFLGTSTAEALRTAARRFVNDRLDRLLNPRALARLREHQAAGDRTVLLTASPEIVLREWASRVGFDDVIGTKLEVLNQRLTGRLDGPNCRGAEKATRLSEYVGPLEAFEMHAYGDSTADWHLLNLAEHRHYRSFDSRRGVRRLLLGMSALLRALV